MYEHLEGELVRKTPTEAVVAAGGVGYRLELSLTASEKLPAPGQRVRLLVHHKVQDDRFRLFGFLDEEERSLFLDLLGVAGVGPGHALALLSGSTPGEIWQAIAGGDHAMLSRVKGIGTRIAQRVCTELADKASRRIPTAAAGPAQGPMRDDAVAALLVLGYNESQAARAVDAALEDLGRGAELQSLIRRALREKP